MVLFVSVFKAVAQKLNLSTTQPNTQKKNKLKKQDNWIKFQRNKKTKLIDLTE